LSWAKKISLAPRIRSQDVMFQVESDAFFWLTWFIRAKPAKVRPVDGHRPGSGPPKCGYSTKVSSVSSTVEAYKKKENGFN